MPSRTPASRESLASWLGLNRATVGVLAVIGCLGLSEEVWSHFLSLHLADQAQAAGAARPVLEAVLYIGLVSSAKNLLEGAGYILGGTLAHHMGPRVALAASVAPMIAGFALMLGSVEPAVIAVGAVLMTNWEPLSVPATFEVVGAEVPKNRRTIAFAVQSIQKRVPKVIGPAIGGLAIGAIGYWLNLTIAIGLVGLAVVLQLALTRRMRPRPEPARVPYRTILRDMPPDLRRLLTAEIFIRWGDWFARDFAVLYVVLVLTDRWGWAEVDARVASGYLLSLMGLVALATYVPVAKWADRASSPRPFIGATFLFFALFPMLLVLLPRASVALGWPAIAGLVGAYVVNGLREFGEPARKALISLGFPVGVRARGIGLYWGLRSFAFFPAPIVAALMWRAIGPDATFLIGGGIGLIGTMIYSVTRRSRR